MATQSVNEGPTAEGMAAMNFDAAFDEATRDEMEAAATCGNRGITRRVGLAIMTRSKTQLVEGFGKDDKSRELLATTFEQIDGYIEHLKAVVETMETARARLICVAGTIDKNDMDAGGPA